MAVRTISGAKGELLIGFKTSYPADVKLFNKLVPHSFPFVSTTLNPILEFIQSASKTRTGAQPDRVISNEAAGGELVTEVLPATLPYLLLAALNSSATLTNRDPLSTGALAGTDIVPTAFSGSNVSTASANKFPDIIFNSGKDFGAFPGYLTVTFSTQHTKGKVTVIGQRANGIAKSATKPFSRTYDLGSISASTAIKIGVWQKIEKVVFSDFPASTTGTATLGVANAVKKRDFKLSDDQSRGIDIQGILDDIPFVLRKAIVNSFSMNISDSVRATLGIIASEFIRFAMINSTAQKFKYDTDVANAALTNFPVPGLDFYTPLGGLFEVGSEMASADTTFSAIGATLVGRDMSVEINHNYEQGTGFTGELGGGQPQESETGRVVSAAATVDYTAGDEASDTFIQWQQDARSRTKRAVRSTFFGVDGDGKKTIIQSLMKSCELTEMPAIDSADRSTIPVTLNYEAKAPSGATTPEEVLITTWT